MIMGYFGKYPGASDYVQHGLNSALIDAWLSWCQGWLHEMQSLHKSAWVDFYLQSPLWEFIIRDRTLGSSPLLGVMVPSVDRQGRYFPFTIIRYLAPETPLLNTLLLNRENLKPLEECVLSLLEEPSLSPQAIQHRLGAMSWAYKADELDRVEMLGKGVSIEVDDLAQRDSLLVNLLCGMRELNQDEQSYWMTPAHENEQNIMGFLGLPDTQSFALAQSQYEIVEAL